MALYELSLENSSTEIVEEQVQAIMKLLNNSKDFEDLIKNPTIKQTDQKNIFNSLSKQFNFNELLTKFLNFLIQKRRLFYINLLRAKRGISGKINYLKKYFRTRTWKY